MVETVHEQGGLDVFPFLSYLYMLPCVREILCVAASFSTLFCFTLIIFTIVTTTPNRLITPSNILFFGPSPATHFSYQITELFHYITLYLFFVFFILTFFMIVTVYK